MYVFLHGWRCFPLAAALLGVAAASSWAEGVYTIDFPIKEQKEAPPGLSAVPTQVTTPDGLGYTEVLLRPVKEGGRVFLTFVFNEDGGRGPAVFWTGDASGKQVTISENLAEGVTGINQRTLALPAEVAAEPGRLYLMGRQDRLLRLRIDWCDPASTFVATDQERPLLIRSGQARLDRELTGQTAMTPPDAWFGSVLDAALQDGVADLSVNTEFVMPLKGRVGQARLRAKFLGLPLRQSVKVWVNGKFAGRLQPTVPGLTDPGYVRRGARMTYAGWREGGLYLEPGLLTDGDNSFIFESPGKGVYLTGTAIEIEAAPAPEPETKEAEPAPPAAPSETEPAKATPTPTPEAAP